MNTVFHGKKYYMDYSNFPTSVSVFVPESVTVFVHGCLSIHL